jgi:hypothetical protein
MPCTPVSGTSISAMSTQDLLRMRGAASLGSPTWPAQAVLVEHRVPVVHVAGVEAVEVVEPQSVGLAVERAGGARLPRGGGMVLADPGGYVSVLPEHLADGAAAVRQNTRVAFVTRGRFGDAAERRRMVVAAGDEGARVALQSAVVGNRL